VELLDWLFHLLHIAVIVINTTFWMNARTLPIAQLTLLLTAISWAGFGFYYGFGYCFLTDWHWQIKQSLGQLDLPNSYIKFIVDKIFAVDSNPMMVDTLTAVVTILSVIGCATNTYRLQLRKGISS
jgi:hypothetical protein